MPPYLLRPAATDIEWWIIKGEAFDIVVPVLDAAGVQLPATGGWTGKAQVRRSEREPVLHEWSAAQANLTVSTSGDLAVTLSMVPAQTSAWAWVDALVSVEVYEPTTLKPHVIARGPIHAEPEITQ